MGMWTMKCTLGFSTRYANQFSRYLDQRATVLDQCFRTAHAALLQGMSSLHEAVDSALSRDETQTISSLDRGLTELAECNQNLAAMVDSCMCTRADLARQREIDSSDPLIQRERFFALIDWDQLYLDLVSCGAALPQRVFWNEVESAIRSGGAQGGLRLLESQLRDLQTNLCSYIRLVEAMHHLPMQELSHSLHNTSLSVSSLVMELIRFLASSSYISLACERAMLLWEQELETATAAA